MNKQRLGPLAIEILNILTDPKTDDHRMTTSDIYARSSLAESLVKVTQTLSNCAAKRPPLTERHAGAAGSTWSITQAGIARLNGEAAPAVASAPRPKKPARAAAPEVRAEGREQPDDADETPVLDCAVWMSGDVSILHGDTNITLSADEGKRLADHLFSALGETFASTVADIVMGRITAKLFDHPDDKAPASDPGVGFTEAPFVAVDPGKNDQGVFVQPNKFDAFLAESRPFAAAGSAIVDRHFTADMSTEAGRQTATEAHGDIVAASAYLIPREPTEATGLPGVEFDGPQGIEACNFGQPPAGLSRAEQFIEAAARN